MEQTSPCSSMATTSNNDISLTSLGSSPTSAASTNNDSGYSDTPSPGMITTLEASLSSTSITELSSPIQVVSGEGHSPLSQLMERTGCSIVQQNGQRRYGPPRDWQGPPPPRGTEVFVGKIPRDCFEDELVPLFEKAGTVYEFRLMMDQHTGLNRGYAFVVYSSVNESKECVKTLNNAEVRLGRTLGVCMSVDNCRLFIGGIPKRVSKMDIHQEMQKVTEGVVDVIVYPSAIDKSKNRGFAFIEYESHRSAAMARRKLMNGRVQLWGHNIAVDWAEPELEVDQEIMAQVKVLYVRNLMLGTTEGLIDEAFSTHAPVERVKKIKDYAFVHFTSKEDAHVSMDKMNGTILDGAVIEVTLAKPVDKETYLRSPKYQRQFSSPAIYVPVDQYGTVLPFYPSYVSSPKYMLRNSMGACTMMRMPRSPFRPPGGQNFYPMTLSSSNPRFFPTSPIRTSPPSTVIPTGTSHGYFELPHHMGEETPIRLPAVVTHPSMTIKPKNPVQLLEELCLKNNWAPPVYSLHSTSSNQTQGGEDVLFLYKVTISAIGMTYMPSKLSRTVEEARSIAADYTLSNLSLPVDAAPPTGYMVRPPFQYAEMPTTYVASPTKPTPVWTTLGGGDPTTVYASAFVDGSMPGGPPQAPQLF